MATLLGLLMAVLMGFAGAVVVATPAHAYACVAYDQASPAAITAVQAACNENNAGRMFSWGGGHAVNPGPTYGICEPGDAWNDCHVVGFDCSGFVRWAWSVAAGRDILGPREQSTAGGIFQNAPGQRFAATATSSLQPGDLLFWKRGTRNVVASHTAMYLGGGLLVEAYQSGSPIHVATADFSIANGYIGALRVDTVSGNYPSVPDSHLPGQTFSTWGTNVRARSQPNTSATITHVFAGPTIVKIQCQKHGQTVTAEGYTNDMWAYIPGWQSWITNIYVRGPAVLPGVPDCVSGIPLGGTGGTFTTWATNVRVRSAPSLNGYIVTTLASPSTVQVACQLHGDTVSSDGYVNTVWSYLPAYGGYITNIYIKGPAVLPGVPDCATPNPPQTVGCVDGSTPSSSGAWSPRSTPLWGGRLIELRYSNATECAWGRISSGGLGDEVWVDRSYDNGHTWDQLGITTITSGNSNFTVQYNDHAVVMRACGQVYLTFEIACTGWW